MRHLIFLLCITITSCLSGQSLIGAWEAMRTTEDGRPLKNVVIFTDAYQVSTWYHAETGAFVSTNGGSWSIEGNMVTEIVEFDTKDAERVGTTVTFEIKYDETSLSIVGNNLTWTRLDSGAPGALQGAWLMAGRMQDGEAQMRETNRPRKTMKILSGTRFQWIAYDTEKKEFKGTGGGTYTTIDGKYTEHIEFFSRDDTRTGRSLSFDFTLQDGNWHHQGFSSKGDPLHEIWSPRTE